jgi:hypothetical protein
VASCCVYFLSALQIATTSFKTLFIIALFTFLIASWLDVPLNALAIEHLPEAERSKMGGFVLP